MTYPKSHSWNVTGFCHKASGTYKPSPPNAPEYLIPRSSAHLLRSSALVCTATALGGVGGGGEGLEGGAQLVSDFLVYFNTIIGLLIRQLRGEKLTWM